MSVCVYMSVCLCVCEREKERVRERKRARVVAGLKGAATLLPYRGTPLIRKPTPLGPYRRPMPRVLGGF